MNEIALISENKKYVKVKIGVLNFSDSENYSIITNKISEIGQWVKNHIN